MHFTTSYSTLDQRKKLHNSNIHLCWKVGQVKKCVQVTSSYSTDVKEVYDTGKYFKLFCDTNERFIDKIKSYNFT